jgi:hypothetical protein
MRRATTWPLAAVIALAACRTMQGQAEVRAYVVRPTPESRSALAQAVQRALDGTQVMLEDDALTRDGVLNVDRTQRRDPTQLKTEGRDPSFPGVSERFHLIKDGERCVLVHDRTDRHYDLLGTVCAPL